MEIVEFLTARIEGDERRSWEYAVDDWGNRVPNPWLDDFTDRLRVECKAKRALLDWLKVIADDSHACDSIQADVRIAYRHLATVYANHTDYQQEWTP